MSLKLIYSNGCGYFVERNDAQPIKENDMKTLSDMLKVAVKAVKPTQKVKGKDLYSGAGPGNSSSHCQGDGGW